jgi:cytidyltransferase-like protein
MSSVNKVKSALLFLTQTLDDIKLNHRQILEESFKYTKENLYIYINPLLETKNQLRSTSSTLSQAQSLSQQTIQDNLNVPQLIDDKYKLKLILNKLYQNSFKLNPKINVTCLLNNVHSIKLNNSIYFNYDLILTDLAIVSKESPVYKKLIEFCFSNIPNKAIQNHENNKEQINDLPLYSIDCGKFLKQNENESSLFSSHENDLIYANNVYHNSIMGGTFDRLHIGHKIMISEAVLLTKNNLLVGVTDESMLKRKKLVELIEDYETRCLNVKKFVRDVAPDLNVLTVQIADPFGPSITERDYQVLFFTFKIIDRFNCENNY